MAAANPPEEVPTPLEDERAQPLSLLSLPEASCILSPLCPERVVFTVHRKVSTFLLSPEAALALMAYCLCRCHEARGCVLGLTQRGKEHEGAWLPMSMSAEWNMHSEMGVGNAHCPQLARGKETTDVALKKTIKKHQKSFSFKVKIQTSLT